MREPIFISLPLHFTLYTLHHTPKNGLPHPREPIFIQKGHFHKKKQNFSQKICVIRNKVVTLHAKIKENS